MSIPTFLSLSPPLFPQQTPSLSAFPPSEPLPTQPALQIKTETNRNCEDRKRKAGGKATPEKPRTQPQILTRIHKINGVKKFSRQSHSTRPFRKFVRTFRWYVLTNLPAFKGVGVASVGEYSR